MPDNQPVLNRRDVIKSLAAAGTVSIAGCQEDSSNSNNTSTATAAPDGAPEILAYSARPEANGQTLVVGMEAEDDEGLEYAAVQYGDRKEERTGIEGRKIDLNGELTDLGGSELEENPGQVLYLARDTAGQETRVEEYPDETAPELLNFSAEPTENAGEIALLLEGRDDVGLEEIQLLLGEQPQLQENVSGQQEYSTDQTVDAPEEARFQQNTVAASLKDWNGNTGESEVETYVRRYDVMDETRVNIGAEYFPAGARMFTSCLEEGVETDSRVDDYGDPIRPETTNKHIDQMTGFGIPRVNYTYEGNEDKLEHFLKSNMIDQIEVGSHYYISEPHFWNEDVESWKDDLVKPHMNFISDMILRRDNVATQDNRPMFTISNASGGWTDHKKERIMEEWGSYKNFVDDIRSHLRVDGVDPYIVGGFDSAGEYGYAPDQEDLATQFDAVTNGKAAPVWRDGAADWEEMTSHIKENYRGHRKFAENHGLDFLPVVIPGFDDRANTCWGGNRYLPRSQEGFQKMLQLADKYRTISKIDIATWNDWTEGHQIEPGTFRGKDYGTEYLEIIENFQQK